MQYVFSMTSRMVAIACACAVLLCILLFLMGVEIGKVLAAPPVPLQTAPGSMVAPQIGASPAAGAPAGNAAMPASTTPSSNP